jgi:hypothetical protein
MWHHCKGDMWHRLAWQGTMEGTMALIGVDKWTSYCLTCGSCGKVVSCHVAQSWAATWNPFSGSMVLEKCLEFTGVNPVTYGSGIRLGRAGLATRTSHWYLTYIGTIYIYVYK